MEKFTVRCFTVLALLSSFFRLGVLGRSLSLPGKGRFERRKDQEENPTVSVRPDVTLTTLDLSVEVLVVLRPKTGPSIRSILYFYPFSLSIPTVHNRKSYGNYFLDLLDHPRLFLTSD